MATTQQVCHYIPGTHNELGNQSDPPLLLPVKEELGFGIERRGERSPIPDIGESGGVVREYPDHLIPTQTTKVEEAQADRVKLQKIDGEGELARDQRPERNWSRR